MQLSPCYTNLAANAANGIQCGGRCRRHRARWFDCTVAALLDIEIAIPDHTTLGRRGGGLTILPKLIGRDEPLHILIDSTGLKIYGEGEWLDQKRGIHSPSPRLTSSFHRGRQRFSVRAGCRSAISILQPSKSMVAWADSIVLATTGEASLRLQ